MDRFWKANGEVMYSVAHFVGGSVARDEILAIGDAMNASRAGVFTGIRKQGDGFTCEVCTDGAWAVHARAIREFISEFSEAIRRTLGNGMLVVIDVAIEPEDKKSMVAFVGLSLGPDLLSALGSAGVRLDISSY
jgi:hypothetical protein